ncbi:MAG: hypothetical protein IPK97_02330 [Ahniella sp.]|nr:hypothetical protein [Ahniella sp.]
MNHATHMLFVSTMDRVNTLERQVRDDYYRYLLEQGDDSDTYDAYMARYARFARFGQAATLASIDSLRRLSGTPMPNSLVDFYLKEGSFDGGGYLSDLVIHAAPELVAKAQSGATGWNCIRSIGLVDMIILSWGGHRMEFDPASGEGLTEAEVLVLNQNYSVIGWHTSGDGEAFDYLYFDTQGRFGITGFHQDDFESFYAQDLLPMTRKSPACLSLDEALAAMLRSAEAATQQDDEDSD